MLKKLSFPFVFEFCNIRKKIAILKIARKSDLWRLYNGKIKTDVTFAVGRQIFLQWLKFSLPVLFAKHF
jgi:hypothetical protein